MEEEPRLSSQAARVQSLGQAYFGVPEEYRASSLLGKVGAGEKGKERQPTNIESSGPPHNPPGMWGSGVENFPTIISPSSKRVFTHQHPEIHGLRTLACSVP